MVLSYSITDITYRYRLLLVSFVNIFLVTVERLKLQSTQILNNDFECITMHNVKMYIAGWMSGIDLNKYKRDLTQAFC